MPKPAKRDATDDEYFDRDFAVAATVQELSSQLKYAYENLRKTQEAQFAELKTQFDLLGRKHDFRTPALCHNGSHERPSFCSLGHPIGKRISGVQKEFEDRCEDEDANATGFTAIADEEVDETKLDMLMAVLDVDNSSEDITAELVKQLLRNRNKYTDELADAVETLFALLQPTNKKKTQSFSPLKPTNKVVSIPFMTFAKTIFMDEDNAAKIFDENSLRAISQIRELSLSDDAREVVKAILDLKEFDTVNENASLVDHILEPIMSVLILANAFSIGYFAKRPTSTGQMGAPEIADMIFGLAFAFEMCIKLLRHGFRRHFMGIDRLWNRFDAFIVLLGLLDLFMTIFISSSTFNPSSFTALRIIRLARLTRLARIVRIQLFRELKLMLYGIVALLRTLLCAILLLLLTVYFLGIIMVQTASDTFDVVEDQGVLFNSLPLSMFTVFRCLMIGDCTALNGTPLALHMHAQFGWVFTLVYCAACIVMNYGVGSLITALVVDSTLNAAKLAEFKQSLNKEEKMKTASRLHRLATLLEEKQQVTNGDEFASEDKTLLFMNRTNFDQAMKDSQVKKLLDELDIDETDQHDLFEALDSDGNGRVEIEELIQGVVKMRGKARKVDVVAARLMLKTLSSRVVKIDSLVRNCINSQQELMEVILAGHQYE
eukprot:TRINITY_DN4684_c0_g4_i1.p1 TRINITY_DN4684_c0_g4~~TRINITY_DN4684_c0_g4_i1.p1  ORF type:complete len:660 (+),score=148.00 TRINITY_DN4684_c0_g4_i1:36-2015(+)